MPTLKTLGAARRWPGTIRAFEVPRAGILIPLVGFLFVGTAYATDEYAHSAQPPVRLGFSEQVFYADVPFVSAQVCEAAERFVARHGGEARLSFSDGQSHPTLLYGFSYGGSQDVSSEVLEHTALRQVLDFIGQESVLVGLPTPADMLALESVHTVGDVTVVRLQQLFRGLPVLGGQVIAILDAHQSVRGLSVTVERDLGGDTQPRLSRASAVKRAYARLLPERPPVTPEPVDAKTAVVRIGGKLRLVWDLSIRLPDGPYRVLVDAVGGEVLSWANLLRRLDCTPKPRGDVYASDPLEGPPSQVELLELDCAATTLNGEFIQSLDWVSGDSVFDSGSVRGEFGVEGTVTPGGIVFSASADEAVAQITVYHHATAFHRFFAGLGFSALDRPFPAVSNVGECYGTSPCANAFYDQSYPHPEGPGAVLFGRNLEVNFALDALVIGHEYTHAVVDHTASLGDDFFDENFFFNRALNEAFADYFPASTHP